MVHKLVLVAAIGLATSAACIGTAAAIGGASFRDGIEGFSLFDGRPRCEANTAFTARSRDLDWDGSDHAGMNLMGQASYTPGTDDRVHASGDPQVLAHLRIRKGTVELDCRGWRDRTRELAITLPGREFRKFEVTGGRLMIARLDQSRVSIEIAGSGKVRAAGGKLDQVHLEIAGSGEMDFGDLTAERGRLEIAGSGTMRGRNAAIEDFKMEIAGTGRGEFGQITARTAKAEIAGSGTVITAGAIDDLKIEIAGSGRADFGKVVSRRADVDIGGHGEVDIAPTDYAKIDIGGSADVNLHSNPKQLETDIGGSGRIHRLAAGT